MSEWRRRIMTAQKPRVVLPAGYTRLEYVYTDADNQGYINTKIVMKCTYTIELDFKPLSAPGTSYQEHWGGTRFRMGYNGKYISVNKFGTRKYAMSKMAIGDNYHIVYSYNPILNKYRLTIGDIYTVDSDNTDDIYNFLLFNSNAYSTRNESYCQISYFKVSDGETPLMELIPAKKNSNSVVGMYDLVSKGFLTPVYNTGTLAAGPEI